MTEKYGRTMAEDYYFTAPYKIGLPRTEGEGQKVVIMMASAGLLKGDRAECRILCGEDTQTELTDQSYTKVFDTGDGEASRNTEITVGDRGVLDYHPCPVIPYANSTFCGHTQIDLKETSTLYFTEIMTAGRIAMGEKFTFRRFENRVQIHVEGRPVYLELNKMIPEKQQMEDFFYFDGWTHQGTFYYYSPQMASVQVLKAAADSVIRQYLDEIKMPETSIFYGITEARKGMAWKILACRAQDIEEIFTRVKNYLKNQQNGFFMAKERPVNWKKVDALW